MNKNMGQHGFDIELGRIINSMLESSKDQLEVYIRKIITQIAELIPDGKTLFPYVFKDMSEEELHNKLDESGREYALVLSCFTYEESQKLVKLHKNLGTKKYLELLDNSFWGK